LGVWKVELSEQMTESTMAGQLVGQTAAMTALLTAAIDDEIQARRKLEAETEKGSEAEIKAADRIAAFHEATCLAGFSKDEAITYFGEPPPASSPRGLDHLVTPWPTATAQAQFIARFEALCSAP
jgi:hypothetical protein